VDAVAHPPAPAQGAIEGAIRRIMKIPGFTPQ